MACVGEDVVEQVVCDSVHTESLSCSDFVQASSVWTVCPVVKRYSWTGLDRILSFVFRTPTGKGHVFGIVSITVA